MPANNSLRLHDEKRLLPTGPEAAQENPKDAIKGSETRLRMPGCQDSELLPQGQVFEKQVPARTERSGDEHAEEPQRTKHVPVVANLATKQSQSAICFAAMFDGEDEDGVTVVVEADAVVANAQAQLGRLDILKSLHVAFTRGEIAGEGVQDVQRRRLIDCTQIGLGLVGPGSPLLIHDHCPGWRGSGASGVCPMRSKSSAVRPNSARTSSFGMGS